MHKAALVFVAALTLAPQAIAQSPEPPPPPPGIAAPGSPPMTPSRPQRRGGKTAPYDGPITCDQPTPQEVRKCMAKNINAVQREIGRKIAESCARQIPTSRGATVTDERLACRYNKLTALLESVK